ncbi:VIT1/CCC1 transporter family protein [Jannaschia sp. Os4]|uniref:VIT1/CCC1 transporter family protein n=1 Tax=Jannaschia sp. Os4 TaxID=2807617 RepID=UPI00193A00E9|nr:VIT1/CCC1 transporter family protein [Jannaschia sp. Os4]MBM2576329.1 VIT1/CCC1 transporter family protein [Jannaschia sp. Os4]
MARTDPDRPSSAAPHLREAVLGAIDGTVTTFAIVAGVAGAGLPVAAVLALGTANVVADGFSMAAGVYVGGKAAAEDGARRRARCADLVDDRPAAARARLAETLAARGLSGEPLAAATEAVARSRAAWIGLLVDGAGAPQATAPLRDAAAVFAAFVACGMLPLVPFALGTGRPFAVSAAATAATFLAIGALRSRWSPRRAWSSAAETLLIGGAAAGIAHGVARLWGH